MEEAGDVERGNMEIDSTTERYEENANESEDTDIGEDGNEGEVRGDGGNDGGDVWIYDHFPRFRPHSSLRYIFELPRVKRHSKSNVQYEDLTVSLQWIRVMLDRIEPVEYDVLEETGRMIQSGIDACADAIPVDALRYFRRAYQMTQTKFIPAGDCGDV
ncbi:hypothetical protein IFM89_019987 [Coptis chinensis]|uniref:Uncharacterized protein n=1 Tax=Coptis chinensis TaxID=261450 RepID=A0A835I5P0_9MAGN|nr:hypothetical protein IFM89_019987 [Coptis chinensis]